MVCKHFIEADQTLGWCVFFFFFSFFVIPTSQSLLSEQGLLDCLRGESMFLTKLFGSCKWLISRERHGICLCVY